MIGLEIEIKGDIRKQLGLYRGKFKAMLQRELARAAYMVEGESKKKTPVDTGRLRSSIRTHIGALEVYVAPNTNYAIYVHEGTQFMNKRPFMKWGAEAALPKIQRSFNQAIKDILR